MMIRSGSSTRKYFYPSKNQKTKKVKRKRRKKNKSLSYLLRLYT